jgi:hypothetical protein
VAALLVIYLLPWIAAVAGQHPQDQGILAVTLLLGWTGVGWLAALAYALARSSPESHGTSQHLRLITPDREGARFHRESMPSRASVACLAPRRSPHAR